MLMILAEERAMRVEAEKMSFMVVVVGLIFSVVFWWNLKLRLLSCCFSFLLLTKKEEWAAIHEFQGPFIVKLIDKLFCCRNRRT